MVASIGNFSFITLKGEINTLATSLSPFSRPGINGVGFQDIGTRGEETTLNTTVDLSSLGAVDSTFLAYRRIQGTRVNITNDRNVTYTNVLILGVSVLSARPLSMGRGGLLANPAALLTCSWRVKAT